MVKWWLERGDQYTVTHMGTYLGTCGGLSAMAILSLPVAVWYEHPQPYSLLPVRQSYSP